MSIFIGFLMKTFARVMGLLFGSVGAHIYPKSGQLALPLARLHFSNFPEYEYNQLPLHFMNSTCICQERFRSQSKMLLLGSSCLTTVKANFVFRQEPINHVILDPSLTKLLLYSMYENIKLTTKFQLETLIGNQTIFPLGPR